MVRHSFAHFSNFLYVLVGHIHVEFVLVNVFMRFCKVLYYIVLNSSSDTSISREKNIYRIDIVLCQKICLDAFLLSRLCV